MNLRATLDRVVDRYIVGKCLVKAFRHPNGGIVADRELHGHNRRQRSPHHQPHGRIAELFTDVDPGAFAAVQNHKLKALARVRQHHRQIRRELLGRLSVFINHDDEAALVKAVSARVCRRLRFDATMPDKMKNVPFPFEQLVHQVLSSPAADPPENHPFVFVQLVDTLFDPPALLGDIQFRPFVAVGRGDHAKDAQRALDAHRPCRPRRLEIADERQPETDVADNVIFLVQILPRQRRQIGGADPQLYSDPFPLLWA